MSIRDDVNEFNEFVVWLQSGDFCEVVNTSCLFFKKDNFHTGDWGFLKLAYAFAKWSLLAKKLP